MRDALRHLQGLLPGFSNIDSMRVLPQSTRNKACHLTLVFYQQDPHRAPQKRTELGARIRRSIAVLPNTVVAWSQGTDATRPRLGDVKAWAFRQPLAVAWWPNDAAD